MSKKMTKKERLELLHKSMREINKDAKKDVIHFGKDEDDVEKISVGVPEIDELLGGGIAYGRVSTIWGGAGSGKTTVGYSLVTSAQKKGKIVYYIALEGFDPKRAKKMGVDLDSLLVGHFSKAEPALDSIVKFAREGLVDVIILDSIQALSPKNEQEEKSGKHKSLEKDTMALIARKLSQFFRVAIDPIGRNKVAVFLIGQTRTSLGSFIALEQLSGGNSLRHYSKLILHIRRGQKADSPIEKYKEYYTEDGKEKYKTKTRIVGFDCVVVLDKTQITGTKIERTKIHIPYYYESGFSKIDTSKCSNCQETFGEDGLCKCQREELEPKLIEEKPKKKRGRPRTKRRKND